MLEFLNALAEYIVSANQQIFMAYTHTHTASL